MLHRVLSIAVVKNLCRHNAVFLRLRGELTFGRFQLSNGDEIFIIACRLLVLFQTSWYLTVTVDIIIQSEPE